MTIAQISRTGKEIIRHFATRLHLNKIIDMVREARSIRVDYLQREPLADKLFSAAYEKKVWTLGDSEVPLSGAGSSLRVTSVVRANLPNILAQIGCRTMLDVGCGDLTWMSTINLPADYIGIDVVQSVIERNSSLYANTRRKFHRLNAINEDIPEADTILCREILFHLSFSDIHRLLCNLAMKHRAWLIATTDVMTFFNADIRTGDFRILNLRRSPFKFPEPEFVVDDSGLIRGRQLGVWRFAQLSHYLERIGRVSRKT
jgi:2-polyprenyl-3-methyl-5-hydroxy-6-metoxy-1,4-benzoquinol methylase